MGPDMTRDGRAKFLLHSINIVVSNGFKAARGVVETQPAGIGIFYGWHSGLHRT